MIHTSCKLCVFKKETLIPVLQGFDVMARSQTGCQLNRLELYEAQGAKIERKWEGNQEYCVIQDKICPCIRSEAWSKEQKEPPEVAVRKEISLSCDIVINTTEDSTIKDVEKTVTSAANQKNIQPSCIMVVLRSPDIHPKKVIYFLEKNTKYKGLWKIEQVFDNAEKSIDTAIDKLEGKYYASFQAGYIIPANFLYTLDKAINDKLESFAILKPVNDNGLVVQHAIHKYLGGNKAVVLAEYPDGALIGNNITDKIEWLAEQQKLPHMVKNITDICQMN